MICLFFSLSSASTSPSIFSVCTVCPCIRSRWPVLLSFLLLLCPVACLFSARSYFPIFMPFSLSHVPICLSIGLRLSVASACLPAYLSSCVFLTLLCCPFPCPFVCLPAGLTWASSLSASLSVSACLPLGACDSRSLSCRYLSICSCE